MCVHTTEEGVSAALSRVGRPRRGHDSLLLAPEARPCLTLTTLTGYKEGVLPCCHKNPRSWKQRFDVPGKKHT